MMTKNNLHFIFFCFDLTLASLEHVDVDVIELIVLPAMHLFFLLLPVQSNVLVRTRCSLADDRFSCNPAIFYLFRLIHFN